MTHAIQRPNGFILCLLASVLALVGPGCGTHFAVLIDDAMATRSADDQVAVAVALRCHEAGNSCPRRQCVTARWYPRAALQTEPVGEQSGELMFDMRGASFGQTSPSLRRYACNEGSLGDGETASVTVTSGQEVPSDEPMVVEVQVTTTEGGGLREIRRVLVNP